jgi:hypothetical protein
MEVRLRRIGIADIVDVIIKKTLLATEVDSASQGACPPILKVRESGGKQEPISPSFVEMTPSQPSFM